MRSRLKRRRRVMRSASGDVATPSFSSRARTNASIGFRTQAFPTTSGGFGRCGGMKAQCLTAPAASLLTVSGHSAPWSIQLRISPICAASRGLLRNGIRGALPIPATRLNNALSVALPGLIGAPEFPPANAGCIESSRRPFDCRSGPWQPTQYFSKIGWMSRWKETRADAAPGSGKACF